MKTIFLILMLAIVSITTSLEARGCGKKTVKTEKIQRDLTSAIPEVDLTHKEGWDKVADVAQYKQADWSHAIALAKGITLEKAFEIGENDPNITYFFHMKGCSMVLETENGDYRQFKQGDTVFFSGEPWWGEARGFADGYIKES